MNLTRLNIVLGILLVIAAACAIAMDVDHTKPNVEFLPDMKRSPASAAFSENTVFPNGRTLQPRISGSIPRGDLPMYYTATKEDAVRAGEEIQNLYHVEDTSGAGLATSSENEPESSETPAPSATEDVAPLSEPPPAQKPDPQAKLNASIQRGAQVYGIFCISCHGPSGAGDGPVTKRGFPPPPPLPTGKSVQMKDGQLFHILTYGQGSMSSMAAQLDRSRRWDVINYVRSMQSAAAQSQETVPITGDTSSPPAPALKADAPAATADESKP